MKTHRCIPNSKPGDPCRRFVKVATCGNDMRCNSISSRCVSDKEPSWLLSMLGFAPYNGYGSTGCGRGDLGVAPEDLSNGCHSMSCRSPLDCATSEFCGIFVDENGHELPFDPNPKSDSEYLSVAVVGDEAIERRYTTIKGFCIPKRSLNQYCTSDAMCMEGLGCDLESSSKCRILCYSHEDCSVSSLLNTFPGIFNESNRQFLIDGQCFQKEHSTDAPGFCMGFTKSPGSIHQNATSSMLFPIVDGSHSGSFWHVRPHHLIFGSLLVLIVVVLSSIWCCGRSREGDRIANIRKQQKRFVRLARSGAAPSSNLFTSSIRDGPQPPSASYPWNNPSRY